MEPDSGFRMKKEGEMRICIPTEDDAGVESRVYGHFGSAPFFTIVDVETARIEVVAVDGHHHQLPDHHISELKAHGVGAVVCDRIGKRACAALRKEGIDVLAAVGGTVSDVLEAVNAGQASTISPAEACGGRGHGRRRLEETRGPDRGQGRRRERQRRRRGGSRRSGDDRPRTVRPSGGK
jgi:predicted Fe-Mo cluster-binding NifX family protein